MQCPAVSRLSTRSCRLPLQCATCCTLVLRSELLRPRQIPRQHFKNSAHDLIKCNASCPLSPFPGNFPPGLQEHTHTRFHWPFSPSLRDPARARDGQEFTGSCESCRSIAFLRGGEGLGSVEPVSWSGFAVVYLMSRANVTCMCPTRVGSWTFLTFLCSYYPHVHNWLPFSLHKEKTLTIQIQNIMMT